HRGRDQEHKWHPPNCSPDHKEWSFHSVVFLLQTSKKVYQKRVVMSTIFSSKSSSYLIHSKHVSFEKRLRKLSNKSLTGRWVSKTGRTHLYASRTHGKIFKHVGSRLDASEPNYWCFYGLGRFPNQPLCDWLNCRA